MLFHTIRRYMCLHRPTASHNKHNKKCRNVQGETKKRELLKNPTKIEEIQEKKIIDRN